MDNGFPKAGGGNKDLVKQFYKLVTGLIERGR